MFYHVPGQCLKQHLSKRRPNMDVQRNDGKFLLAAEGTAKENILISFNRSSHFVFFPNQITEDVFLAELNKY